MKLLIRLTRLFFVSQMMNSQLRGELSDFGEPFKRTNPGYEIIWSDAAPLPPETVPHYSAGDHRFSQKTIEHFKTIGGFSDKHRVPAPENLPSRKDSEVYATETKNLSISPVTGCLSYNFSQENVDLNLAEAPTVETVKELAKKLAIKPGFDLFMQVPPDPTRLIINRVLIDYKEAEIFRKATSVVPMLFLSGVAEANGVKEDFSMYLPLP